MARGNEIVVSGNPKGVFLEGIVSGTPKPGTIMEIKSSVTTLAGGRHTWQVYQPGTNGQRRLIAVLLADRLQGKLSTDAYVDGTRCFLYCPIAGEEMNVLLKDVAGTGDAHSMGETLIVETGSGKLIATTGSPQSEPFRLMEAIAAPTADTLAWAIYTGY